MSVSLTESIRRPLPPVPPRILSLPPASSSIGGEAVDFCRSIGLGLDDWQEFVLAESLAIREDAKWAAFEAAVEAARQNGKNEIALARQLVGLFLIGENLLIHSAHEFKTSTEHQRRVEHVIQNTPDLHAKVKPRGYRHSHGEEGIELRSGQRIRFMTRTKGGGRGHTGDLVVFDEAMVLPASMLGALMPTLSARSVHGSPQLWYFFTAVDQTIHDHGLVAARLRERALAGGDPSLAYFGWSADVDGRDGRPSTPADVSSAQALDPRLWLQANPALGIRISEEHVANEQRSMDARTFAVERLGVGDWPATDGVEQQVIDLVRWAELEDERSRPVGPLVLAFDVAPDRSSAAVSAAGDRDDGLKHVEVVDWRRGTGWVVGRVAQLVEKHSPAGVFCDGIAAGSLVRDLAARGVLVTELSASEYAQACGLMFDQVDQSTVRHLGQPELDDSLRGAGTRTLGTGWAWKPVSSDITPLVSATIALWGAGGIVAEPWAGVWR